MRQVLLALLLPLGIASAAELRISEVTLSAAGIAEIERRGDFIGQEPIRFRAPLDAIDDILRTLILRDPVGRITGLTLPAQDLLAEAFRDLPVKPEELANRVALFQALAGQTVTVSGITGRLADAESSSDGLRLTLITADGIRIMRLPEGEMVRLADTALNGRLEQAATMLAASRQSASREIEIGLTDAEIKREVSLRYLIGSPVWKPSWRLILSAEDKPARLQGWAVVENRSGADWEGIRLNLVSGAPAAYHQALYAPLELKRPERPVHISGRPQVPTDTGARPPPAMVAPLPAPAAPLVAAAAMRRPTNAGPGPQEDAAPPPPLAPLAQASASAAMGRLAYRLPLPITLPAGTTANLPFLDVEVPAEKLWWLPDPKAHHPLNAVRLRNTLGEPLPDGLAAVFGSGGFLGDTELPWLPSGEARLLGYAQDRDIVAATSAIHNETPVAVVNRRTAVEVTWVLRDELVIVLTPDTATGTLVIDLPRRQNYEARFPIASEGDFGLRVEARLTGSPATFRYGWERRQMRAVPLWDGSLGDPLQIDWRSVDFETKYTDLPGSPAALERLAALLRALPPEAVGRPELERRIDLMRAARQKLDAARGAVARASVAQVALDRARQAADDRTGRAKEDAKRQLNAASLTAEEAGRGADVAWLAWRAAVEAVIQMSDN
jgi:Domain of unknown function (DUF4139)